MYRSSRRAKPVSALAAWADLALKTSEMMLASAHVIGHRTRRMASAGPLPNARDQREFKLMGQEKVDAAGKSARAIGRQVSHLNLRSGLDAWKDMLSAGHAAMSVASSRTVGEAVRRQAILTRAVKRAGGSASMLSHATVEVARRGLKPIHAKATANAKRLARR